MKLEYLVETIKASGAKIHNKDVIGKLDAEYNLNRTVNFSVGEKQHKIVWFHNLANLHIDENTQILFNNIKCQNTWPVLATDRSKNQLQFIYGTDKVCIMITERYE